MRRGEADAGSDDERSGLGVIGGMKHEAAAGFDRAAEMNRGAVEPRAGKAELAQHILDRGLFDDLVDDEAHRAIGIVRAHEDHRPHEARILHLRHGDEQLSGERCHDQCP